MMPSTSTSKGIPPAPELSKDQQRMQFLVRDYLCPICEEIIYHAVQTSCGHHFCRYCLLKWIQEGNMECPLCEEACQSFILLPVIDAYIDNEFACVSTKLQKQRQVLIGSRYFPERQLCMQDAERQARAEIQAQAQKQMNLNIHAMEDGVTGGKHNAQLEEGTEEERLTGLHIGVSKEVQVYDNYNEETPSEAAELDLENITSPDASTDEIRPDFSKVREEINDIFNQAAQVDHRRLRRKKRLLKKEALVDYSKVKAEIRDIIIKTERQKEAIRVKSELDRRERAESLDILPKVRAEIEERVKEEITDNLCAKIKIETEEIMSIINQAKERVKQQKVADAEQDSNTENVSIKQNSCPILAQGSSDSEAGKKLQACSSNNAPQVQGQDSAGPETPEAEENPLNAIARRSSGLRAQVERFKNDTEEFISMLEREGLAWGDPKKDSKSHSLQDPTFLLNSKKLLEKQILLENSLAELQKSGVLASTEPLKTSDPKTRMRKVLGSSKAKAVVRKPKERFQFRRRQTRLSKHGRGNIHQFHSASTSLEVLSSSSPLDLTSMIMEAKPRREASCQGHNKESSRQKERNSPWQFPAEEHEQRRSPGNGWYLHLQHQASVDLPREMRNMKNLEDEENLPPWQLNARASQTIRVPIQTYEPRRAAANTILFDSLESHLNPESRRVPRVHSNVVFDSLQDSAFNNQGHPPPLHNSRRHQLNMGQQQINRIPVCCPTFDPSTCALRQSNGIERNVQSNFVFSRPLPPKIKPKRFNTLMDLNLRDSTGTVKKRNELLFGTTSPYINWKPGMVVPVPPLALALSKSETESQGSSVSGSTGTHIPNDPSASTKGVSQRDKERIIAKVRQQLEDERKARQEIQVREQVIRKLIKERRIARKKKNKAR